MHACTQWGYKRVRKATKKAGEQDTGHAVSWFGAGRREVGGGSWWDGRAFASDEDQLLPSLSPARTCSRGWSPHWLECPHFSVQQHGPGTPTFLWRQMGHSEMHPWFHYHANWWHRWDPEQRQVQEYSPQGFGEQGEGKDILGCVLWASHGEDHPEATTRACDWGRASTLSPTHLCSAYSVQAVQEDSGGFPK